MSLPLPLSLTHTLSLSLSLSFSLSLSLGTLTRAYGLRGGQLQGLGGVRGTGVQGPDAKRKGATEKVLWTFT